MTLILLMNLNQSSQNHFLSVMNGAREIRRRFVCWLYVLFCCKFCNHSWGGVGGGGEEEEEGGGGGGEVVENNKLHFFSWESSSFVGANRIFGTRLFFHQLFTLRHHFQTDQQIKNALKHTKTPTNLWLGAYVQIWVKSDRFEMFTTF